MNKTLITVDTQKLYNSLSNLKCATVAAENAMSSVKNHLQTKPVFARDIAAFLNAFENCGFDPAIQKAKRILKSHCSAEKLNVAIAYESIANKTEKQFYDVGVEAENALANLYNLHSMTIVNKIAEGYIDAFKFNPVIAKLIKMAKDAKLAAMQSASGSIAGLALSGDNSAYVSEVVPVVRIAQADADTAILFIDGQYVSQGKLGALTQLSRAEVSPYVTGNMNAMLTALESLFKSSTEMPNVLVPSDATQSVLSFLGIQGLTIDMQGYEDVIQINGRTMTLEQIKSFFSTANNDYVVARTTKPGFDTASKAILDGIESLALNRGYLLENFVSKLTFDSDNARNIIYLGNSKERFLTMLVTNENLISLETFENAYALLASQVLIQNVAAHSFAENMFKQSLTAEAASYNSKKLLAEEWTRDLND
jgi:hypothetical protein